jgi:hypothetical protein
MITQKKLNRAFKIAKLHNIPSLQEHIQRNVLASIDEAVAGTMTSKQIAQIIKASHHAWHDGKLCAGLQIEQSDGLVWVVSQNRFVSLKALVSLPTAD